MPLEIHTVEISALKPADYNPRQWSDAEMEHVKESIRRFGFVDPVIVNSAPARKDIIIGGHFRVEAAKALGMVEVPVVYVDIPELEREKELNLRLNRNTGRFDYDALANLFDTDYLLGIGFTRPDLFGIEAGTDEQRAGRDAEPIEPPAEPVSKLGELYELGPHRLLCGDSTKTEHVAKLTGGGVMDMLFTDPPYGVNYTGKTKDALTIENDAMTEEQTESLWRCCYENARNVLKPGGLVYATVPAGPLHMRFVKVLLEHNDLRQILVWVKDRFVLGRSDYHYRHEPILYGWKSTGTHNFLGGRDKDSVWEVKRPSANKEHPTMKPVELIERAIRDGSKVGESILDLFGGSGSTLIAADNIGRVAYLMEIDPRYCDVIRKRYADLVAQK